MQWKNHRLTTCAVTFALTGSFPATAIATAASALPDVLELKLLKHRTLTHYPWIPILLAIFLWRGMQTDPGYIIYVSFFILIGYICHLAGDFLSNSGVPIWSPFGKPIGCRLYVTHDRSEDVVTLSVVVVALFYAWHKGLLSQIYLLRAADNLAIFLTGMVNHFSK